MRLRLSVVTLGETSFGLLSGRGLEVRRQSAGSHGVRYWVLEKCVVERSLLARLWLRGEAALVTRDRLVLLREAGLCNGDVGQSRRERARRGNDHRFSRREAWT
jgi:hypothetical protein